MKSLPQKLMLLISIALLAAPQMSLASAGKTSHLYSCLGTNNYRLYVKVVHTTEGGETKISDWMLVNSYDSDTICYKVASELNSK